MNTSGQSRPLRRDAARNRDRILEAAGELFAVRGLGATLNDIAHYAGLGVGTVYRHFPDKDELIETLFETRVEEIVKVAESGLADPDPWHGLVSSLERMLEIQAADRGLRELVQESPAVLEHVVHARSRLMPLATELLNRAQAAGAIRPDVDVSDLVITQVMLSAVVDAARDVDPVLWRRYLLLMLRGMATDPDRVTPASVEPLGPDSVDLVLAAAKTTCVRMPRRDPPATRG